jgi:hypothetical protein
MEGQELKPGLFPHRRAMALPLTLVFILVGAVLVGAALYVVENMYSTSRHVVAETRLYNAAQSGIEKGKMVLWEYWKEKRDELDLEERTFDGDPDSIRAKLKDGEDLDGKIDMTDENFPDVKVAVDILDCNYILGDGKTFKELTEDERKSLPSQWPGGEGGHEASGGLDDPPVPEGTSVIIDPSRWIFPKTGNGGSRRFVIRSTALDEKGEQQIQIEVMVELKS